MTNEEIVMLIKQGKDTMNNMQLLYDQNKQFIYKLAKKLVMFSDIEDLMQEAYIGLDQAVKHYDSSKCTLFLSYAAFWINQSLRRYVENNGRTIRIPVHELQRVSQYQKYTNEYMKYYGEKPPKEYLQGWLEISEKALENLERIVYAYNNIQSLDEPCGEDGESSKHELIPGDSNIEDEAIEKCMSEEPDLWDIIEEYLPTDEFEVVCMRYHGKLSLEEVGRHLGISRERVRQLESKGVRHLRIPRIIRAISIRYDVVTNQYHTVTTNSAISQMGITRKANAEKRRNQALSKLSI